MKEEWKDVPGFTGKYQISTLGRVRSLCRKGCFLKPRVNDRRGTRFLPYHKVALYKDSQQHCFFIHRLVALTFLPNLKKKPQVNHIDGNVANNQLSNLEWSTPSDNVLHSIKTFGRKERVGEENNKTKLTTNQVFEIRSLYPEVKSQRKLAVIYGVTQSAIKGIVKNRTWKHLL